MTAVQLPAKPVQVYKDVYMLLILNFKYRAHGDDGRPGRVQAACMDISNHHPDTCAENADDCRAAGYIPSADCIDINIVN